MLSVVSDPEYQARRERLGFPKLRPIPRNVIKPLPLPSPEPETTPYKHTELHERDWIDVSVGSGYSTRVKSSRFIIEMTAKKYRVSVAEIKGHRRDKFIVKARHECFYRLSKELGYSLPQIGKMLGGKDHTSVLSGIRRHEMRLVDPDIDDRPTQGR